MLIGGASIGNGALAMRGNPGVSRTVGFEYGQVRQRRPVVVELGLLLDTGICDSIGAREKAVEVVKAAILRIDHHNRLNFGETLLGICRAEGGEDTCNCNRTDLQFHWGSHLHGTTK